MIKMILKYQCNCFQLHKAISKCVGCIGWLKSVLKCFGKLKNIDWITKKKIPWKCVGCGMSESYHSAPKPQHIISLNVRLWFSRDPKSVAKPITYVGICSKNQVWKMKSNNG